MCQRRDLLQAWDSGDHDCDSESCDQRSNFSPEIQAVTRKIEKEKNKYKFEEQFFGPLVDSKEIREG